MAERKRRRSRSKDGADGTGLTEVWRVELTRGLRRLADGDMVAAEGHFERAHQSAPERAEVCFALGRERLRQGRFEEAEALLRAAWSADRMLAAAAALARCLGRSPARRPEAHAVLDEACALLPDEPGLLVVRAELFLDDDRRASARAEIDRARAILDGEDRDAPATRAALACAEARVQNLEGIALGREDRHEEALFAFKRAFDLDPSWSGPMVNMGAVFARLGRNARARACYERALVLDPDNPVARYNLAALCLLRGDLDTAESEYRRVLDLAPSYPGARIALADLLCARARVPDARDLLRCGDPIVESDQLPLCARLAARLAASGDYIESARLIRAARELDPAAATAIFGPVKTDP